MFMVQYADVSHISITSPQIASNWTVFQQQVMNVEPNIQRRQETKKAIRDRKQPMRGPYGHMWHPCRIFAHSGCFNSLTCPYSTLAGPAWAPYSSRRIWKILEIPMQGPYNAHTSITQDPCGVLRIIWSNHQCTAVSSRTRPIAWCDHENSTGVKFLWSLQSALWARNLTGAKMCMVKYDWGIKWNILKKNDIKCQNMDITLQQH